MSEDHHYEKHIPVITPTRFGEWKFLFKAYLNEKECIDALTKDKPELDARTYGSLLHRDGSDSHASREYARKIKRRLKDWNGLDRKAYGYLVRACKANASAMEVILREELADAKSKDILAALEERFSQAEMVGVIQAKLAASQGTGRKFR